MKAYDIPGLTTKKDLDIIYEWARTVPENGVIVEIGPLFGRTTVAFAEGAMKSVKIYSIDYFDTWECHAELKDKTREGYWLPGKIYNKEIEFKRFTENYKNIFPLKLEKGKLVYEYDKEPIDIFFIDGHHRNPSDILNISHFRKFVKNGGMICGHDYHTDNSFPDIEKNVKLLEKIYNTTVTQYKNSSMWFIRIK